MRERAVEEHEELFVPARRMRCGDVESPLEEHQENDVTSSALSEK
jgi:hypothetical protein